MATSNTARDFPLAPLQSMVWPLAILLMLVLPVAIVIAAAFGSRQPMPGSAVAALSVVLLLMLAALALLKRRRIALEDGVLVVAATFYTRKTAAQARIASLDEHTEFRPGMKTNGYALPGFQAGHFRLRNRAKAFCLLTTQQRVLILPQRDGAFLLLSPERPQALLDALRTANTSS